MENEDKDLRVEIKIQNNQLYKRIATTPGFKSMSQWCRDNGEHTSHIGQYLNFRRSPVRFQKRPSPLLDEVMGTPECYWRAEVSRVAKLLGCLPEDLFPSYLWEPRKNIYHVELTQSQAVGFLNYEPETPEQILLKAEQKRLLTKVLSSLPEREEAIIKARFGYGLEPKQTLDTLAEKFGCTKERIRQIEHKALRRLRHKPELRKSLEETSMDNPDGRGQASRPLGWNYAKDAAAVAQSLGYMTADEAVMDLYLTEMWSCSRIGDAFGMSKDGIRYRLQVLKVKMRPRGGNRR